MRTRSLGRFAPWSQPFGTRSLRGGPNRAHDRGLAPRRQVSEIDINLARPISRQVRPLDHDFVEETFVKVRCSCPDRHPCRPSGGRGPPGGGPIPRPPGGLISGPRRGVRDGKPCTSRPDCRALYGEDKNRAPGQLSPAREANKNAEPNAPTGVGQKDRQEFR